MSMANSRAISDPFEKSVPTIIEFIL
jgi:hypothetical protein